MEKTTLAEAYRRRESIETAHQAIFCKGRNSGITRRIVFHARQPDGGVWYNVWLVSGEEISLVAMHMGADVLIGPESPAYRKVTTEGRPVSSAS